MGRPFLFNLEVIIPLFEPTGQYNGVKVKFKATFSFLYLYFCVQGKIKQCIYLTAIIKTYFNDYDYLSRTKTNRKNNLTLCSLDTLRSFCYHLYFHLGYRKC